VGRYAAALLKWKVAEKIIEEQKCGDYRGESLRIRFPPNEGGEYEFQLAR